MTEIRLFLWFGNLVFAAFGAYHFADTGSPMGAAAVVFNGLICVFLFVMLVIERAERR